MLVVMRAGISGTRTDAEGVTVPWPRQGMTVDLPEAEAQHLIGAGLAYEPPVSTGGSVETATAPPVERADMPPRPMARPGVKR